MAGPNAGICGATKSIRWWPKDGRSVCLISVDTGSVNVRRTSVIIGFATWQQILMG